MSSPIGDPPNADGLIEMVNSFFRNHSYGPFSVSRVNANYLIFSSETYPVQFELMFDDEMTEIEYKVYETPQPEGETFTERTKRTDGKWGEWSWESLINKLLMSISGSINGNIQRGDLEPRE